MKQNAVKLTKNQAHSRLNERGSIIVWILIFVSLFAALSYTVSQGSRSGASNVTAEQANLAATEILDYATALKRVVQELKINGCSDTEISFENSTLSGYTNSNSPSDNSCHVFHPNGGGLQYLAPNIDWLDTSNTTVSHHGTWYTTAQGAINGLGIDASGSNCPGGISDGSCHELITGIPFINRSICEAINQKLGWGSDSSGTAFIDSGNSYGYTASSQPFNGNYAPTAPHAMGGASPSNYSSITAGCIEGDSNPASGTYSFFQVLIVR